MKKILVIEDDADIRRSIRKLLTAEHFLAIEAVDGNQGVALAREMSPDLILCDILMPDLDGYAVLKTLNADSRTQLIPFIFLTGLGERRDQRLGMEQGANDFISTRLARERQQAAHIRSTQSLPHTHQILQQALDSFIEEMRNPLTNIKLVLELFGQASVSESQRDRYLKILQEELDYQVDLLDKIDQLQLLLTPDNILLLNQFGLLRNPIIPPADEDLF